MGSASQLDPKKSSAIQFYECDIFMTERDKMNASISMHLGA